MSGDIGAGHGLVKILGNEVLRQAEHALGNAAREDHIHDRGLVRAQRVEDIKGSRSCVRARWIIDDWRNRAVEVRERSSEGGRRCTSETEADPDRVAGFDC